MGGAPMLQKSLATLLVGVALAFGSSAHATMTTDRDDFENAVSDYTVTSTYGSNFSQTDGVSLGGVATSSSSPLQVLKIGGPSTGWDTGAWVQKYTGQVLFSNMAQSITLTFDTMVTGFSFLATGNLYATNSITLSAGGETLTQDVTTTSGTGSGAYFAWFGNAISSLTISTSDTWGFAFGKIAVATNGEAVAVPGPEAGAGVGAIAMLGIAYWAKRRRQITSKA